MLGLGIAFRGGQPDVRGCHIILQIDETLGTATPGHPDFIDRKEGLGPSARLGHRRRVARGSQ